MSQLLGWACLHMSSKRVHVLCRLHMLTRHRVFTGPGFAVATELGDAASGGQVLLSQDAWLRLEGNMGQAAFPTLEQLGLFKLEAWPAPIWIYQVSMFACWSFDDRAWGT